MKVIKFLFVALAIVVSHCLPAQKVPKITINIANNQDSVLYLCYTYGDQLLLRDSAKIKNNKFIFKDDKIYSSGMYFLVNQNKHKLFDVLIDDNYKNFEIALNNKNILSSLSAKNSKINSDYFDYLRFINLKQREVSPYVEQIQKVERESESFYQIKKEIGLIEYQVENYIQNIINKNQNNVLGLLLKASLPTENPKSSNPNLTDEEAYSQYLDNFFLNFDVADVRLLRTPIYQDKINEYLDEITIQSPKRIIFSVDKLIERVINSEEVLEYLLWHVTAKYEEKITSQMGFDAIFVHIIDQYYIRGIDTWTTKSIVDALINKANEMRATLIGEKAPNIELYHNNKAVSLYDINAPFTLIYFWTDDCGNCKKVTEHLLKVYSSFQSNYGLEIFGVYAGHSLDDMNAYINENNIKWSNAALQTSEDIDYVYLYNVSSTPYLLLIDVEKNIISKRFIPEDLEIIIRWKIGEW